MSLLKAPLPDHLLWLTEKVERLVRPAAFLIRSPDKHGVAPLGGTFTTGRPDAPSDYAWSVRVEDGFFDQSPYDGESFVLQLNLEDIPAEVREPQWPRVGVVWVTIDLSDAWRADARFDPRPAATIPWIPRTTSRAAPRATSFAIRESLTQATELTLPEIASDYREGGMAGDYDDWQQRHYGGRQPSNIQLGGWLHPIQGDTDQERETLMLGIEKQSFGDSGAVYLHFSSERGFFAYVTTC